MGNFTEDLAKGFVRSAVNQVGRDGGKVISNSIYGNAHSTPIRGIGKNTHNQFFDESTNEVISHINFFRFMRFKFLPVNVSSVSRIKILNIIVRHFFR